MYNVDTLTVCSTHRAEISRMTITMREDEDEKVKQVMRQIEKVTEVISVRELDRDQSYWRELAILKIETDCDCIDDLSEKYGFELLDQNNNDQYTIQVSGISDKINQLIHDLGNENIIEIARTGVTAMQK